MKQHPSSHSFGGTSQTISPVKIGKTGDEDSEDLEDDRISHSHDSLSDSSPSNRGGKIKSPETPLQASSIFAPAATVTPPERSIRSKSQMDDVSDNELGMSPTNN